MERNLALYPAYQAARSLHFWVPVFFLYFSSAVSVADVFLLEAIYYAGVVALEVPSGYFSDRLGRRPTLIIAACSWTVGATVFALTGSFWTFAVAQLCFAAGRAFNSGTDSSLAYDTLLALGREAEFGALEGRAWAWGFGAAAIAALCGGAAGAFDLGFPYILTAIASGASIVIAARFLEPTMTQSRALPVFKQLRAVGARIRRPKLLWIFTFIVAMTVFNHVPYELFQPYIALAFGSSTTITAKTPLVAGLTVAVAKGLSALASRYADQLRQRFGAGPTLLGLVAIQFTVLMGMALVLHPLIVFLIAIRSIPSAVTKPVAGAVTHPELDSGLRATYLSVQSLAGRLAFSASLLLSSLAVGHAEALTRETMVELLYAFSAALALVGVVLIATVRVLRGPDADALKPPSDGDDDRR